jgi:RNA recognition motif-containing protein
MSNADTRSLWVGDIEAWMDEKYVTELFSKTGQVVSVKIIKDKSTGSPSGYGFVEFASHEIAQRVL